MQVTSRRETGALELRISDRSDWGLFELLAGELARELRGEWVDKIDGMDQRYWDLRRGTGQVTLHLEHYLGVSLFPARNAPDAAASELMIHEAYAFLRSYEPA